MAAAAPSFAVGGAVNISVMAHNDAGSYSYLPIPGAPFSGGVAADDGYDIVHAVLTRPVPLADGYGLLREHLASAGRPLQALCGMELRSREPLSGDAFREFNRPYIETLNDWGLGFDGAVAPARTNVCPIDGSIHEPSLFAFSYTAGEPALPGAYLMAGATESDGAAESAEARLESIVGVLTRRLGELGGRLDQATAANFYAAEGWEAEVGKLVLPAFGGGAPTVQMTWVASLPPLIPYQMEIDVRRCGTELSIDTRKP